VRNVAPYRGWKRYAANVLRIALRAYIRYAPWNACKAAAFRKFQHYVAWQRFSVVAQTRYGFRVRIQVRDLVSCVIYLTGQWEPYLSAYLKRRLRPGDVFVDVGANIGYYSLLASRLVGNSGSVYSIEASTTIYAALIENIALNCCKNIVPINAAASDAEGELIVWQADESNLGHSTTVMELAAAEGMKRESTVRADAIDSLLGPSVLKNARLVKIDVEGAERIVLAPLLSGASRIAKDTDWLIELTPDYCKNGLRDSEWIFNSFIALGYSAFVVPNRYDVAGYLARPKEMTLTRVTSVPQHQADILFTLERPQMRAIG
jgi:FkbM family methyltransferase